MNRLDKLKILKNRVSHLIDNYRDLDDILDELSGTYKKSQIVTFYKHLIQKAELEEDFVRIQHRLIQLNEKEDDIINDLSNAELFEESAEKHLLHVDDKTERPYVINTIIQGRYLVYSLRPEKNNSILVFHDLLQDKIRSTIVKTDATFKGLYELKFPYFLIKQSVEVDGFEEVGYYTLARFDSSNIIFKAAQTMVYSGCTYAFVDTYNPSKFILKRKDGKRLHFYELANGSMNKVRDITFNWSLSNERVSYFDDKLYDLQFDTTHDYEPVIQEVSNVHMVIHDLEQNEPDRLEILALPENLIFADLSSRHGDKLYAWNRDQFFAVVGFEVDSYCKSVVFTGPQTQNWTLIEFACCLYIDYIQFAGDDSLLVSEQDLDENVDLIERRTFKIPLRRPNLLRDMAWNALIKKLKKDKVADPYAEANKFLPLNSDIQNFVFYEN